MRTVKVSIVFVALCLLMALEVSLASRFVHPFFNFTIQDANRNPLRALVTDSQNDLVYIVTQDAIAKVNGSALAYLDQAMITSTAVHNKLASDLYNSEGWLFFLGQNGRLYRHDASNLTLFEDVSLQPYFNNRLPSNFILDAARRLAYVVSHESGKLVVVDVVTMSVTAQFNISHEVSPSGRYGPVGLGYDSTRQVLWIGSNCPSPVLAYVWQIDMKDVHHPKMLTVTPFGGWTCFYADPIIDTDSGIVFFSDEDSCNVYGIYEDGSWDRETFIPLPMCAGYGASDVARKQGFYAGYSGNVFSLHIYRFCYTARPATMEIAISMPLREEAGGLFYDHTIEVLYLNTRDAVYAFKVNGTDCPQNPPSAASTVSSALWTAVSSLFA